jgi:hypothetical protein
MTKLLHKFRQVTADGQKPPKFTLKRKTKRQGVERDVAGLHTPNNDRGTDRSSEMPAMTASQFVFPIID